MGERWNGVRVEGGREGRGATWTTVAAHREGGRTAMAGWNTELGLVPAVGQWPRCESPRPCHSGGHQGPSPMLGLSPIVGICCLFQVPRWGVVPAEQTKKLSPSAGVEPQRPGCCTPDHATAADANALCCGGTVCYLGVFILVSNTPRWGFRPSRNNPSSSVPAMGWCRTVSVASCHMLGDGALGRRQHCAAP